MIFLFSHTNCPTCGSAGSPVKGMRDVRRCGGCYTTYSEFAVILEGMKDEKEFEPS